MNRILTISMGIVILATCMLLGFELLATVQAEGLGLRFEHGLCTLRSQARHFMLFPYSKDPGTQA